jgi:hypothetical protein
MFDLKDFQGHLKSEIILEQFWRGAAAHLPYEEFCGPVISE